MAKKRKTRQKVERDAVFHDEFRQDLGYWVATNRKVALRLATLAWRLNLIEAVMRDPFKGIGKPEPLKHLPSNTWSRRLTQEHRLVYLVTHERIDFLHARYHY